MADQPSASVAALGGNPTDEMTYMDAGLYGAAAKGEDVGKLKEHLSADGLGDQLTPRGNNLLHIASQFGQMNSVKVILAHLGSSKSMFLLKQRNLKGDTALHLAAREGHHKVVKALIEATGSVEKATILMKMKNKEGGTALHEAVRYNHEEVVKLLVEKGPNLTYDADCSGYTPRDMAVQRGYGMLQILKAITCNYSPAHSGTVATTPLHEAVKRKDLKTTRQLLKEEPSLVNKVDPIGWSPLHYAAHLRQDKIAEEILKSEALDRSVIYLGIKDGNQTALHLASWAGFKDIVKLLLQRAPDCSEQVDAGGKNAFHFAMMNAYRTNMGSDLLEVDYLGVRGLVNEKDAEGHTPFRLLANAPKITTSSGFDNDIPFTKHKMVDEKERMNQSKYAQEEKVKMPTRPNPWI